MVKAASVSAYRLVVLEVGMHRYRSAGAGRFGKPIQTAIIAGGCHAVLRQHYGKLIKDAKCTGKTSNSCNWPGSQEGAEGDFRLRNDDEQELLFVTPVFTVN